MESSEEKVVAVIMVGGPTKGKSASLVDFLFLLFLNFLQIFLDFFFQELDLGLFRSIPRSPYSLWLGRLWFTIPFQLVKGLALQNFPISFCLVHLPFGFYQFEKCSYQIIEKKKKKLSGIPRRICNYILLS